MAVRDDFTAGEVLAAADLNDTFGAKANLASPTFTGTPELPTTTKIDIYSPFAAWVAYTPVMTVWTQGNGTLFGLYLRAGRSVDFWIGFSFGSTSVAAASAGPQITLPFEALLGSTTAFTYNALAVDSSLGTRHDLKAVHADTTKVLPFYALDSNFGQMNPIEDDRPMTWATGDNIVINGRYYTAS
jgi:hypothetical protein